ncbi:hypothetical protein LCI18_003248 [Fusarium solani-melongenae]|uniref:Uncharacterized protein n=1 Tax=Fusarium solani subsp. cucurbitae TaxID=2747967 RepID=A0ACD3YWS2_FUSSC|nr:hypothetical protein LCI18_003248 [Fusarium solani-melongenae]
MDLERSGPRLRNIEDNDQVARLQGHDIDASTPLWQHDKAWIRRPAQLVRAAWRSQFLSKFSFITSHYAYFIIVCLVSSLIFWGSSSGISYVDSLFLVVSAMTATGLTTVSLSQATTGQQVLLFLLIIFGSRIWISICIVYSRKRRFNKRFDEIVREARTRRRDRSPPRLAPSPSPPPEVETVRDARVGEKDDDEVPYLSWTPTIGRNSQFYKLTSEQRDELGGIEFRALKLLLKILLLYFFFWQFLGCISLGSWINNNKPALGDSPNLWWLGIFNGVSAFNNSGMSLLDASMVPFQRSYFVLITMGLMILAGRTAFPIFLRLILWSLLKIMRLMGREYASPWEALHFILDHPRRVYVYLWPRGMTWYLLTVLIFLNTVNWVGFLLFNLNNPEIESIPTGSRVLAGLFQALSIRFGGFHITNIANLRIGLQALYVITMLILAYPIRHSVRRTNVYEERSLGIFNPQNDNDPTQNEGQKTLMDEFRRFRRQLNRGSVRHDAWALMLAILVITTIESGQFRRDPVHYSVFNIMFEVVSAYGCVGVSVGLLDANYSFSGGWHAASKVILCAVMLRGRHRGLPEAIDRAILLPSEARFGGEEEGGGEEDGEDIPRRRPWRRPTDGEDGIFEADPDETQPGNLLITRFLHPGPGERV